MELLYNFIISPLDFVIELKGICPGGERGGRTRHNLQ